MVLALRVLGATLQQVAAHFSAALVSNIVAFILSAPLVLAILVAAYLLRSFSVVPFGIMLLLGVLPNPAAAGLQYVVRESSTTMGIVALHDHLAGLRSLWLTALKTWSVSVLVTAVILLNLAFYSSTAGSRHSPLAPIAAPLDALLLVLLFAWLSLHLFVYPLLFQQEVPGIRLTYRNAFVMSAARPVFTCVATAIWLALLFLCSATGLTTIIGLALGAYFQHNAFTRLLPSLLTEEVR